MKTFKSFEPPNASFLKCGALQDITSVTGRDKTHDLEILQIDLYAKGIQISRKLKQAIVILPLTSNAGAFWKSRFPQHSATTGQGRFLGGGDKERRNLSNRPQHPRPSWEKNGKNKLEDKAGDKTKESPGHRIPAAKQDGRRGGKQNNEEPRNADTAFQTSWDTRYKKGDKAGGKIKNTKHVCNMTLGASNWKGLNPSCIGLDCQQTPRLTI